MESTFKVGDKVVIVDLNMGGIWKIDEKCQDWEAFDYWIVPAWREYQDSFGVYTRNIRKISPLEELL